MVKRVSQGIELAMSLKIHLLSSSPIEECGEGACKICGGATSTAVLAQTTNLPRNGGEGVVMLKSGASSFMDARIVVNVGQQPPPLTWCLHYLCISHRRRDGMYHDIFTDR